jgi:uncharacterized protein YlaN (UPF0358 family)
MELLFKVDDETKVGKAILDVIYAAIKQDKRAVQLVEEDFMDNLIFPGKPLTEEQFDKMTVAMEDEGDYMTLEKAKKETMALLKKKRNENRNKKKGEH